MGGDDPSRQGNTIVPETGAAKYWYVDPSATGVATQKVQSPVNPMYASPEGQPSAAAQMEMIQDKLRSLYGVQHEDQGDSSASVSRALQSMGGF